MSERGVPLTGGAAILARLRCGVSPALGNAWTTLEACVSRHEPHPGGVSIWRQRPKQSICVCAFRRAQRAAGAKKAEKLKVDDHVAVIAYASQTGTAQDIARSVDSECKGHGIQSKVGRRLWTHIPGMFSWVSKDADFSFKRHS